MQKWIRLAIILLLLACVLAATRPVSGNIDVQKLPSDVFIEFHRCGRALYYVALYDLAIYWDRSYKWTTQEIDQAKSGAITYIVNDTEGCEE